MAGNISYYFSANGYTGLNANASQINQQGTGSTYVGILNGIINLENHHNYIAVVDFDHGVGNVPPYPNIPPGQVHYMIEDYNGTKVGTMAQHSDDVRNAVYDMEIYPYTSPNPVVFAFINTCLSADTSTIGQRLVYDACDPSPRAFGMPFAWTHRLVNSTSTPGFNIVQYISDDGYSHPDWGHQVYIGFPYGSASLSQNLPLENGLPYYYWVENFFFEALYYDYSVNQALDHVTYEFGGANNFNSSQLKNGFASYWWNMGDPVQNCTMAVYGNGNIKLHQFTPPQDIPNVPTIIGPAGGNVDVTYQFSTFAGDPYAHNVKYRFDWGDGSPYNETDWCSDGVTATLSQSWHSGGTYNVRVQARCSNGSDWSSWSNSYPVTIENPPQNYYWVSNITYETQGGYVDNATYLAGSSNDGNFAHIHCCDEPDSAAIIGTMNAQATGKIEIYGHTGTGGYSSDIYVYVSNDSQNWNLVSSQTIWAYQTSPFWIDCGTVSTTFNYIKIRGYDSPNSVCLHMDSVCVTPPQLTRVQGNAKGTSMDNPTTVTLSATPTTGNVLIAVIGTQNYDDENYVTSISQSGVNWTCQIRGSQGPYYEACEIWLGVIGSNPSNTLIVHTYYEGQEMWLRTIVDVCEYSGVRTSGYLDTSYGWCGYSRTMYAYTTSNTTYAPELWVAGIYALISTGLSSPDNGFSLLDGVASGYMGTALAYLDKISDVTGLAWTSVTNQWYADYAYCIITLKGQ